MLRSSSEQFTSAFASSVRERIGNVFVKGIEFYNKRYEQNHRKAAEELQQALQLDPKYSQAALTSVDAVIENERDPSSPE